MTEQLKLGVIGGSAHSAVGATHLAAARMDGMWEIGPCFFSNDESENRHTHEVRNLPWHGHAGRLDRWLDAYADTLDIVVLLTPSTDHADHITELARHRIPFLTEKPVACTRAEAELVRTALEGNGAGYARFVHNYSAYPLFRELVLRLREGRIGEIHHVRLNMPSDGYARESIIGLPQAWRRQDPEIPMILLDLGTHLHHLASMMIGTSAARVHARMHQMANSFGVVDNVEIWEERADGIRASYWMSKAHLGVKNGLEVEAFGDRGALRWRQMDPDHLIEADMDSNQTIINRGSIRSEASRRDRFKAGHPTGFVDAFGIFYSDLAEDLRAVRSGEAGNPWIRPIDEAFDGLNFLATAAEAHQTGNWVDL